MIRFEDILDKVESYKPNFDEELLEKAYIFTALAHKGQTSQSGEPYLIHPLNVAYILAEMKLDETSIVVGLLHDVLEDTLTTKEKLYELFGEEVAEIVDGLTKISRYAYVSKEEQQAETFVQNVDSAAVVVNASTRFNDGAQLGLGAEVAVSTQKLHARGPMALAELTTTKWVVRGEGQVRS